MIRALTWGIASILSFLVAFTGYQYATRLAPHLPALDSVAAYARAHEPLSDSARRVFSTLIPATRMADQIAGYHLAALCPRESAPCQSQGRWHLDRAVWTLFLPLRRSGDVLTTLYAHFEGYSTQSGLEARSSVFRETTPARLTRQEALGLLAIAASPIRYSPTAHPEAYLAKVASLDSTYRARVQ